MAKYRNIKNSFLGGQISPTALARTDLPQYHNACEVLQNMIPMLVGGAYRRPGTLNVDTLAVANGSPNYAPKLIPFIISPTEAYCVAIAASGQINIYRATGNGGLSSNFNKATVTGTANLWSFASTTTWQGGFGPDDDVFLVQYAQSNDLLFLTHPNSAPFIIKRTALDTFATVFMVPGGDPSTNYNGVPYRNQNTSTTTLQPSATSGAGVTLTASAATFTPMHVGSIFKIDQGSAIGAIQITSVTSPTVAVGTVLVSFTTDMTPYTTWWESAWSYYRGYPRSTCIFQQRLCMGGAVAPNFQQLLVVAANATIGATYTDGTHTFGVVATISGAVALYVSGSNLPVGLTLTKVNGTGDSTITITQEWGLTVTSASATILATYTDGVTTFTVEATISNLTTLVLYGPNEPVGTTLTKLSGTGDAIITFSSSTLVIPGVQNASAPPDQTDVIWFSETANYLTFSVLNNTAPIQFVVINGNLTIPSGDTQQNGGVLTAGGYIHFPVDDSDGDGQITGPTGAQPFKIQLAQNTQDVIQWLSPDKELLIGTAYQEWIISTANNDFSIANSPTQIQSKYGSDYLMASRIGYELIFPLRAQDEIRAYQYNYIDASFFAEPIQLLFDQYPQPELGSSTSAGRRKFRWFDWDVSRQTLWCLDTWGNFFGMTRDRKLNTTMWHTHQFGGFNQSQGKSIVGTGNAGTIDPAYYLTDGSVISFTILPNPLSGINDVWLVVKRTINGVPSWQIERMIGKNIVRTSSYQNIFPGLSLAEPFQVDSAVAQSDSNSASNLVYGGLNCLNGYNPIGNYYSYTNGIFVLTGSTVAFDSGDSKYESTITSNLPSDYGNGVGWVVFGLPFTSIIQPTRPDAGSVIGTAQSALKRTHRAFIRVYRTMSMLVGSPPTGNLLQIDGTYTGEDQQPLEQVDFNQIYQPMSRGAELFTGDKKVEVPSTYDRDGYIYIIQSDPMPLTVIGITSEGIEFDG